MAEIDIEMVFDAISILNNPKYPRSLDQNKPTWIDHADIFMVTEKIYLASNHEKTQATADLWIQALTNDTVTWRGESISDNTYTSVIVYKIDHGTGDTVMVYPIVPSDIHTSVPIPVEDSSGKIADPTKYAPETQTKYCLSSKVHAGGEEHYRVYFLIAQRDRAQKGAIKTLGYYAWDPSITATT